MRKSFIPATLGLGCVLLAGCTWVKLSQEGEAVALRTNQEVSNCRQVANTTVTVRDRVLLSRSPEKVTQELHVMARNSAPRWEGDAVVPDGPVRDGSRDYRIYRCGQ